MSKFDPYLFNRDNAYTHEKQKLFESWGYDISDSEWLRQEIERRGLEKYIAGQYTLKDNGLDRNGQRINIRIEIPRRDKEGTVSFITGWMIRPNGYITCNTPLGG